MDNGVRQGFTMSLWLFNVYMDAVMKEVKIEMGRRGESADDMVLSGELEEDLRVMVGWFAEMCRRRGLKVSL